MFKNSNTALSSREDGLVTSITTWVPTIAVFSPSPVIVLTPEVGEAAVTSWLRLCSSATALLPISPVPPMTRIFMIDLCLVRPVCVLRGVRSDHAKLHLLSCHVGSQISEVLRSSNNGASGSGSVSELHHSKLFLLSAIGQQSRDLTSVHPERRPEGAKSKDHPSTSSLLKAAAIHGRCPRALRFIQGKRLLTYGANQETAFTEVGLVVPP